MPLEVNERGETMERSYVPVSERLREARAAKGVSQDELAKSCGISLSAVAMYETGRRIPRDTIKVALSKYLDVPIQDLFF